ncbi:MAG: glycosyltransferase family 4 protein [Thermoproteota archaeon]|jgi:glycosyltransferase involved in cell wall biosynthesis
MKILLLCTHATFRYTHYGEIHNAEKPFYLAKFLADHGHKVTLMYGESPLHLRIAKRIYKNLTIIDFPVLGCSGTKALPSAIQQSMKKANLVVSSLFSLIKSLEEDWDILHVFWPNFPGNYLPMYLFDLFKKSKIILDLEDRVGGKEGLYKLTSKGLSGELELFLVTLLENSSIRHADAAIVTTSLLKQLLLKHNFAKNRIFKIPRGVDLKLFQVFDKLYSRKLLGIDTKSNIITYTGSSLQLSYYYTFLLKVLKEILKRRSNIKLIFLGRRVPREVIETIKYMKLYKNISLTGAIPLHKLPLFLSASDVLVLPLQNNFVDASRWPNRLLEYMASSRPVVASSVGEVKEIIQTEKCGLLAKPDDYIDFSEKLEYLLQNPREADELGNRGRMSVETKYNWEKVSQSIEKVYESLKYY